jgi:hypothetical protein
MRLGNAVFGCRVAGITLLRAELALAGDAALQLGLNFVTASLLDRIGATTCERDRGNRDQDR